METEDSPSLQTRIDIMDIIRANPEGLTVKELAELSGHSVSTVRKCLNTLARFGEAKQVYVLGDRFGVSRWTR